MTGRLPPDNNTDSLYVINYTKFILVFFRSHGSWQILIVATLYAVGIGSVLGLVRSRGVSTGFFKGFSSITLLP